ncbi:GDSL-type esterase/lipase family protein [Millionella massiliensis]|uniref:GDSL-type esterase/lipase family protein n=1 Tax=Millionella massiliensis TaxID=1871023 RepID=UPI0008DA32B6|nr:GDSL-type esterase/lipase family protein [Millionella massiliensis]
MKKFNLIIICLLGWMLSISAQARTPLRVACVGNSITYGAGIANRDANSYPAQLQEYLGDEYEVCNFGVSGRTLLNHGDLPYTQTAEYKASLEFAPDIVLIKLGTNDSKPQNRGYLATEFLSDYRALIRSYRELPSHPEVILLSPVKCFTDDNISDQVIGGQIVPLVRQLAFEDNLPIINLYNLFGNTWDGVLMPDRIHPSSIGAGRMARTIGEYILRNCGRPAPGYPAVLPAPTDSVNFHGHAQYNFTMPWGKEGEGVACHLVLPRAAAEGQPWVLRARFWGHEPQADIALLENGFAIAYCDVANLYGAEEALKRWDKFYKMMTRAGFSKRIALEGMSRGGLPIYNWAVRHPKQTLCIYADAPVMDLKSWPAGRGEAGAEDTRLMMAAYGFDSDQELRDWKKNPIDHAEAMARTDIPLLHIVGEADQVVPPVDNTNVFEKRYTAAGGTHLEIIRKPGVDHHPHSLNNPEPIVTFMLRAAGLYTNPCTRPVPGNEYRSAAGWIAGSEWHSVAEDITATLERHAQQLGPNKGLRVLLLGNSITQGFGGCRNRVAYKPGRAAMDAVIGDSTLWESAAISGDRTQNLLWRLQNGNYEVARPETLIITIGVNNLIAGDQPDEVADGIEAVAREAAGRFPNSRIILFGLLPTGADNADPMRQKSLRVHQLLAERTADLPQNVEYVDPTAWFVGPDSKFLPGLYSGDNIHLTSAGYEVWCKQIKTLLNQ